MSDKYFDFDAAMEERTGKPIMVKAFGETYQLPSDIPFDIVLGISRKYKDGSKQLDENDTIELAHKLFGKETFDDWLAKGIGTNGIMLMIESVMKMYMQNAETSSKMMADKKASANP